MTGQQITTFLTLPIVTDWVAPLVLAILIAIIQRRLHPKAKVIWSDLHQFAFLVPRTPAPQDPNQATDFLVYTKTVLIQNLGKAAAEKVEIYLPFRPDNFQIFPTVIYSEHRNADRFFVITIDRLVKGELVMLEMLQVGNELPDVARVRTGDHVGLEREMQWQRVFSKPIQTFILVIMFLGFFVLCRWAVDALMWALSL